MVNIISTAIRSFFETRKFSALQKATNLKDKLVEPPPQDAHITTIHKTENARLLRRRNSEPAFFQNKSKASEAKIPTVSSFNELH